MCIWLIYNSFLNTIWIVCNKFKDMKTVQVQHVNVKCESNTAQIDSQLSQQEEEESVRTVQVWNGLLLLKSGWSLSNHRRLTSIYNCLGGCLCSVCVADTIQWWKKPKKINIMEQKKENEAYVENKRNYLYRNSLFYCLCSSVSWSVSDSDTFLSDHLRLHRPVILMYRSPG